MRFYFSMFSIWFPCVGNSACHGHVIVFLLLKLNNRGGDSLGEESVCVHRHTPNTSSARTGPARICTLQTVCSEL